MHEEVATGGTVGILTRTQFLRSGIQT